MTHSNRFTRAVAVSNPREFTQAEKEDPILERIVALRNFIKDGQNHNDQHDQNGYTIKMS